MKPTSKDLIELSAFQLAQRLENGHLTSVDLVQACLAQIERYDRRGPNLRAMISVAAENELIEIARGLDEERASGKVRGPFHGIPIIVKDLINVDRRLALPTTLGSTAFADAKPIVQAGVIEKLVARGLIILGKANLTELGNFKGNNITSGWSPVGGQTQSAYVKGGVAKGELRAGRTAPGGSSSGSAVGVSAGYSPLSLGTEADGSVCVPASRAGLYGIKPSNGETDMSGIFKISESFDTVGCMAKTVHDLAMLFGYVLHDEARRRVAEDWALSFLQKDWSGVRVGVVDPHEWTWPETQMQREEAALEETRTAIEERFAKMREAGAKVVYPIRVPRSPAQGPRMWTVIMQESRRCIEDFLLDGVDTDLVTVEDIIKWNQEHADIELPEDYPNQVLLEACANSKITQAERDEAFSAMRKEALIDTLGNVLLETGVDVLMGPMDSPLTSLAACAGAPIATVPIGILSDAGRPFGFALIARPGDEERLFGVMSAYETTFPQRPLPPLLAEKSVD